MSASARPGKYILTAIAVCFPNGLNFINLIGEPLAAVSALCLESRPNHLRRYFRHAIQIHAPVPKYKEKVSHWKGTKREIILFY